MLLRLPISEGAGSRKGSHLEQAGHSHCPACTLPAIVQHYLATTFETNHVRPHIDCERSTNGAPTATARQTHTNPVQSCPIAGGSSSPFLRLVKRHAASY